jgi:hypothetical protein
MLRTTRYQESALITSPPDREISAHEIEGLFEYAMNRTDPSPKIAFTPLGCADEATAIAKAIPKVASAPATTVTILLRLRCLRPFMICSLRAVGLSNSSSPSSRPDWVKRRASGNHLC